MVKVQRYVAGTTSYKREIISWKINSITTLNDPLQ